MKTANKIKMLGAPLDTVLIKKDFEKLIGKNDEPDIFDECIDYAHDVLTVGEYPERNPTWWKTFHGKSIESKSVDWRLGIANLLRLTADHEISEVDNEHNHLRVCIVLEILVINAKNLPDSAFHGAKCVSIQTPFGIFPIVIE